VYDLAVFASHDEHHWKVVVHRPGRSAVTYTNDKDSCMNGVVRPGDRVEVSITQLRSGYSTDTLGAGEGYGC